MERRVDDADSRIWRHWILRILIIDGNDTDADDVAAADNDADDDDDDAVAADNDDAGGF